MLGVNLWNDNNGIKGIKKELTFLNFSHYENRGLWEITDGLRWCDNHNNFIANLIYHMHIS